MLSASDATKYVKPTGSSKPIAYGTAGFRARAETLESTFYRMGMLAVLRSRARGGLASGLMVTASHNPEPDNGIKLVDTDGGMLHQSWEGFATRLANADEGELPAVLAAVAAETATAEASGGVVVIGRDTRPHSEGLASIALEGVAAVGGIGVDCGVLTTPQLHHLVRMRNGEAGAGPHVGPEGGAAWASEAGYYAMVGEAFVSLVGAAGAGAAAAARGPLWVDAACGVGAPKIDALVPSLGGHLELTLANKVGDGPLNDGCGAEWVQKGRTPPRGAESAAALGNCARACSLDGDADRIVFHYYDSSGKWRLLDGDKIAALCVSWVSELLGDLKLATPLTMAAVQTAYANGAATAYMRALPGVTVPLAKTGVKHLHHIAVGYDISVYFEANGHGTVLFSDKATSAILAAQAAAAAAADAKAERAAERLLLTRQLVNQAVGDAISDLLLVEAVLAVRGWSVAEWDGMYADLPSRQSKLPVADRGALTTTDDETRLVAPAALQAALDGLMAAVPQGRCFVRPSGTEDVVRVYAEAATQADADALALKTAQAVHELAGGVGEKPTAV